jgi:hypothetical protein
MVRYSVLVSWILIIASTRCVRAADFFFADQLYPILEKHHCRGCHNENGIASGTRIHFPDPAASRDEIEEFGKSLGVVVDRDNPEKSLLLNKPTARIQHTGGKLILPGSDEEKVLLEWISRLTHLTPEELASQPRWVGPVQPLLMRRLTHSQYNHTVRDLLGDQTGPADQFPQEDFVNGFKNQVEAQGIPPLLEEAYSAVAEKLARNAFRMGDRSPLVGCVPQSPTDAPCRSKFLRAFGLHAFRRPLSDEEFTRYSALFTGEAQRTGRFSAGAQLVVEAMLQSPKFLFVENTGDPKWEPYETASRLSYLLWDSMPDDKLFQAAAAGELRTPQQIAKAASRLLQDPKAHRSLDEFVTEWLRFDRLLTSVKDRRLFPTYTPELGLAMTQETRRLIDDAVWNDRNFMHVFDADYAYLSSDLAALYKLPAPAAEFAKAPLPADSERAGLLGEATFLALTSKPGDTSPTARGLFVREQFLCQHVPDPPPGVNANLPPVSADKPMTNRDRMSAHLSAESCASCHKLMDPIGFGFEKFDAIGAHRDNLKITFFPGRHDAKGQKPKTVELPLDSSGSIAGIPNSTFRSPREIGLILASSPLCGECMVKQFFRYAYGRQETPGDRPVIQQALAQFRNSGFHYRELMLSIAESYSMERRSGGAMLSSLHPMK